MGAVNPQRRRRSGSHVRLLAVVSIVVLLPFLAGCGNDLTGTTWKASMLGNEITLTFNDDETCTVEWGMAGMAGEKRSGPYSVDGDQITVGTGDDQMVLKRTNDTMTGTAKGVTLTFERQ